MQKEKAGFALKAKKKKKKSSFLDPTACLCYFLNVLSGLLFLETPTGCLWAKGMVGAESGDVTVFSQHQSMV